MCGKGMCRKNPMGAANTELAQACPQWNQVIIMHPDQVVGPQQWQKLACKLPVHFFVCSALFGVIAELAGHVMEQRPQRAVRKAVVVGLEFLSAQLD